jgi:hypothetical protein
MEFWPSNLAIFRFSVNITEDLEQILTSYGESALSLDTHLLLKSKAWPEIVEIIDLRMRLIFLKMAAGDLMNFHREIMYL